MPDREKVIVVKEWIIDENSIDHNDLLSARCANKAYPLVRCKDCVFGKREKNDSTGMTWIYCGHHRENRQEDWFCASGSRI
jgi:hypothetical protein